MTGRSEIDLVGVSTVDVDLTGTLAADVDLSGTLTVDVYLTGIVAVGEQLPILPTAPGFLIWQRKAIGNTT